MICTWVAPGTHAAWPAHPRLRIGGPGHPPTAKWWRWTGCDGYQYEAAAPPALACSGACPVHATRERSRR